MPWQVQTPLAMFIAMKKNGRENKSILNDGTFSIA
jgi:hypothetical protein